MTRTMLLAALLAVPATVAAQAHPLIGTWNVTLPAGMRVDANGPTPIMAKGTFTVVAQGDSLIGTLATEPLEGAPARPPIRLATKLTSGKVTFTRTSEAKLSMNGEEQSRTSIATYVMEANGDDLKGTIERRIDGFEMANAGPQPFTGSRVKQP